ncbi:MAG: protoporphyrinogen oxidase HemJ [Hyphomicrobiales bacterium]
MLSDYYLWIKAFHIISVISWMAGLLYLPRLFVYHANAVKGSIQSETFKIMERRLLKAIMNPAMIASWVFGLGLLFSGAVDISSDIWIHVKLLLVIVLSGFHMFLARVVKKFTADKNDKPEKYYRILNEVPTALMFGIVFLAILKPF